MSASILREAAALMRERAEAATSGPWQTYVDPHDDPIVFDQYGTGVQSASTYDVICYSGQIYSRDAEHIASWHPAVALAVADWLDVVASRNEALLSSFAEGSRSGEIVSAANTLGWNEALTVARAYLGRES